MDKYKKTSDNNINLQITNYNRTTTINTATSSNDTTKFLTGDKSMTQQIKRPPKSGVIGEKVSLDPKDFKVTNLSKKNPFSNKSEDFGMMVVNTEQASPYILMKKSSIGGNFYNLN